MKKNENGIYVGCEKSNKPVILDCKKVYGNENAFIQGSVGQGMSFHIKSQILQQFSDEDNITITDPKNEFEIPRQIKTCIGSEKIT